ncbi:hypothetical protein [Pseudomonas sp. SBT1-2]|uniref:hypothetical protein n=1 Tax=Pseudomonas sp. SBT1-2 TaxID=3027852 RepID=UPI002362FA9F|nr:hypothetical protein [Pseudomonas sp. SBT1-2]
MNIISSINRRRWPLLAALFYLSSSYGSPLMEETNFPNSQYQIFSHCGISENSQSCEIYSVSKGGKKKIIDYPLPPSSIRFENNIFVIAFPCGTQCSATYFYNVKKGLSGPFPLVVDYDLQRGFALGVAKNPIQVYRLFRAEDESLADSITLDLPRNSRFDPSLIIEARIKDDSILIEYVNDKDERVTTSRPLPK